MENNLNEITQCDIYPRDSRRLVSIKIELNDPTITKKPDVIHYLINYWYDSKLKNQSNDRSN
jgi:hypothetical protein